jgi:molybdenum cofactor synthesis domain-containing protein
MTTAAALIIGDELLSGKVVDTNTPLLIAVLAELGVTLTRVAMVRDDLEAIGREARAMAAAVDHVFTSGGVGPTHDDLTMEALARAFGVPVVRHPRLEALIREVFAQRLNEPALKLAEVPEGAELVETSDGHLPAVLFRNIFILPGVPQIFAAKLAALRGRLSGHRLHLASVYLQTDESSVADLLRQVVSEFPEVAVGSYPRLDAPDHRVRITLEAAGADPVQRATARLLELLPSSKVVRVE